MSLLQILNWTDVKKRMDQVLQADLLLRQFCPRNSQGIRFGRESTNGGWLSTKIIDRIQLYGPDEGLDEELELQ